jgi:hypothetical protein
MADFVNFNHRRDNGITIYSIFSQKPGRGAQMLEMIKKMEPQWIRAVCPCDLASNKFYEKRFILQEVKYSKSGRALNVWQMDFPANPIVRNYVKSK